MTYRCVNAGESGRRANALCTPKQRMSSAVAQALRFDQRFDVTEMFGSLSIRSTNANNARLADAESGNTLATSGDSTTTLLPLA